MLKEYFENLRRRMALGSRESAGGDSSSGGLVELSILSVIVGVLAGLVIIALNLALHWLPQISIGGHQYLSHADAFESLAAEYRLLIPLAGGAILGLTFHWLKERGELGIPHVIASLAKRDGQMPLTNAVVQFFAATFALLSGQSMGKEGPAVHIGAAAGSNFSDRAGLPNTATRVLVASGAAAAIAAAFDTPLAGVVFAMEVILMEYTIAGFAPVILSTVAATAVSRAPALLFGVDYASGAELQVPEGLSMQSLAELPWLVLCGLVIGAIAAGFVYTTRQFSVLGQRWPIWLRLTLAGLVTGVLGYFVPEIMGLGYDSLNELFSAQSAVDGAIKPLDAMLGTELLLLIGFLLAKLLATAVSVGMGMPAGLIGPTLILGGIAGCLLGWAGNLLLPGAASQPGFYAVVGMGAMMAAVLQAPLAGLLALVELTGNPDVVFPAMLVIVTAYLTCRVGLKQPAIFRMLLQQRGFRYRTDPITQGLRHSTVMEAMDRQVRAVEYAIEPSNATELLELKLVWLLFEIKDDTRLLPFEKISGALQESSTHTTEETAAAIDKVTADDHLEPSVLSDQKTSGEHAITLSDYSSSTLRAQEIDWRMTLLAARDRFDDGAEALYVVTYHRRLGKQVLGVLTPDILQTYIRTSLH